MDDFRYPYEHLIHNPPRYNRRGRPGPFQQAAIDRMLDARRDFELDDWQGQYDDDPNPYHGDYPVDF